MWGYKSECLFLSHKAAKKRKKTFFKTTFICMGLLKLSHKPVHEYLNTFLRRSYHNIILYNVFPLTYFIFVEMLNHKVTQTILKSDKVLSVLCFHTD